jgi:hypothetical protein
MPLVRPTERALFGLSSVGRSSVPPRTKGHRGEVEGIHGLEDKGDVATYRFLAIGHLDRPISPVVATSSL